MLTRYFFLGLILCLSLFSLSCSHASPEQSSPQSKFNLELYRLEDTPPIGTTLSGDSISEGGFSGLLFLSETPEGEFEFLTLTDRGPNGDTVDIPKIGNQLRPFLLPTFQPQVMRIRTNSKNKTLEIIEKIGLKDPQGRSLSGLPQWNALDQKAGDEQAVDLNGHLLSADLMGIDPEGITLDDQGNIWLCEEYRPSLLKFTPQGRLLKRYIPKGSLPLSQINKIKKRFGANVVSVKLPEAYSNRRTNRGFEGLTFLNGKIYAILQSPLEGDSIDDRRFVRLLEFDPKTEKVSAEFRYPITRKGVDKIGDLSSRPGSSSLFAIEQNSQIGPQGQHLITEFKIDNLSSVQEPDIVLSLADIGYDFAEKVEGLAFISNHKIAVVNDNDFAVNGTLNLQQQKVPLTQRKTVLGIITLPLVR